jgi:hypothetical protein
MRYPAFLATKVVAAALLTVGAAGLSQSTPNKEPKPAANAWMLTPTPYLEWNKDVPAPVRAQRDHFWDEVTHRESPLTAAGAGEAFGEAFGGPDWSDDGTEPEIPEVPDRAVLTATFAAHRSVLSASEKSIYTEITIRVEQVFEDKTGAGHLAPHKDITLMLIGGTVALGSGRTLSDHVQPSEPLFQPERSYLLALQYHKEGDWYAPREDWDVTDGVVRVNTGRGEYLAKHGRSRLNGLAVKDLGPVLSEELYPHN